MHKRSPGHTHRWLRTLTFMVMVGGLGVGRASAGELAPEVEARIEAARAAGLPTEPLISKAREGAAKGVPPARVAAVLDGLVADLAEARGLVDLSAPDAAAQIAAAGAALSAGASAAAVRAVEHGPPELRVPALLSLGDLLALSVPEGVAVTMITEAARGPDPQQSVSRLATQTADLLSSGLSPVEAADTVKEQTQGRGRGAAQGASHSNNGNNGNHGNGNNGNHGNGNNGNGNGNQERLAPGAR